MYFCDKVVVIFKKCNEMVRFLIVVLFYFVCLMGLKKYREGIGVRDGNYVFVIVVWIKCLEFI